MRSLCFLLFMAAAAQAATEAVVDASHSAFFEKYCLSCHDAEKQKGKVRLDDIPFKIGDVVSAERWQKVLGTLNAGEMPPEDKKQPSREEKAAFLEHLSKQMVVARKALADSGGVIPLRRLNRREYVNTMRDLLDVEVNAFDLPPDETTGGFDTFGSGLFFSSDQFEQYLKLARVALDDAIVTKPKPERKVVRVECEEAALKRVRAAQEKARKELHRIRDWRTSGRPAKEFGFGDDTDAGLNETVQRGAFLRTSNYLNDPLSLSGALVPNSPFPESISIPGDMPAGRYLIRVRLASAGTRDNQPSFVEFGTRGEQGWPEEMKLLGCSPVEGTPEKPEIFEVAVSVGRSGPREYAVRQRRHNHERGREQQENFRNLGIPMDTRTRGAFRAPPTLWVDWMEWEGPFTDQWPPKSHQAIFGNVALGEKPGSVEARAVLESFASRAFRGRPARAGLIDQLVVHFEERIRAGEPFMEAIKTPLAIILASPRFLYVLEPSERESQSAEGVSAQTVVDLQGGTKKAGVSVAPQTPVARVPLTNAELANRLSYFLWGGPPDERLMLYADTARLGTLDVLSRGYENEVDRLLLDRRVERFIAGFAHQWLHMTRLDFFRFNGRLYPKFDDSLKEAARREVYETIRTVLDEDLPVRTLLKSDFVVVNDLLADYYGLPNVRGSAFRKVSVPEHSPRGGFLGMAAILAMGSDGERSSPVERGAWVLRKLLNDPPPPAPANVPQLSRFGDKLMSARELLTAHQEEPQCAQCHRRIDPIGFALQNFDAAGLWREEEYAEFYKTWQIIQKKQLFPINAAGRLPSGKTFEDFYGLRDAVAGHEEDFARGLIARLVEYALGRPGGFSDDEMVEDILKKAKAKGMTLRAMIHALVESPQFRSK
ncbi:MAG: hypothetical protein RLZZ399_1219 [Verrucomicrobiota bacterium]|jgi:hypothetical protein